MAASWSACSYGSEYGRSRLLYGTSNGQVQKCTVVRKNQMYSAMSEELARMYNAAGRREESLACHLAVRNQLLKEWLS